MTRRFLWCAAVVVVGCVHASTPGPSQAPASRRAPAAVEAEEDEPPCPDGGRLRGAAPPEGLRVWCELPDGREHGPMQSWHHDRQLRTVGGYDHGRPHGKWRSWYEGGQRRSEGEYARGAMVGTWTTWYADGQKATEIQYEGDTASYMAWHPNGAKRREGRYEGGEEVGPWTEWAPDGTVLSTTEEEDDDAPGLQIGVTECDRYIDAYLRCVRDKMPVEIRQETEKALTESVKRMRVRAKKAELRDDLADACKAAQATLLRSMESLGCRFD